MTKLLPIWKNGNRSTWPLECKGVGPAEAPRGALGHWCVIKGGVIANWQAVVVPSTWNASPRDPKGPIMVALWKPSIARVLSGSRRLLTSREILRTILHSFDSVLGLRNSRVLQLKDKNSAKFKFAKKGVL